MKLSIHNSIVWLIIICIVFLYDLSFAFNNEKVNVRSGHFFSYSGKVQVLIGDSGTQSVMQNLNVNYKAWLDELNSKGIRSAMIWSWMAVPQKKDGSVVDRRYGYMVPDITPWVRSGKGIANDGGSLWDLKKFDDRYWYRLKDVLNYAENRKIVMVMTVFDGWPKKFWFHPFNKSNGGPIPQEITVPKLFTQKWLKNILLRTNDSDGREHFWTLHNYGDEVLHLEYDDLWPWELKNQYFQERFAEKLIETTCHFSNVIYELVNEGSSNDKYDQHWLDFFSKRCDNLILINDDYTPLNARANKKVDVISWHTHPDDDINDIYDRWVSGFHGVPAKPVVNTETVPGYYDDTPSLEHFRKLVWITAMAGGGIFVQDDTVFGFDPHATHMPKGEVLRNYLGHANLFFNGSGINIEQMSPYNKVVKFGRAFVLAEIDREYIIYVLNDKKIKIDLSDARGSFNARWFHTTTGKFSDKFSVKGGSLAEFNSPFLSDAALHLVAVH